MNYSRSKVVEQAQAWLGYKESNGTHKEIIDVYNSQKKLPRSYPVKYTDQWCATFVSAVSVKLGYTSIMPTECGCEEMIKLYQKLGCWDENDARVPNPGEVIFYYWKDKGNGDCKGYADHVGIVEKVSDGEITVIEGNYSNSVKRRPIEVNDIYIRGYGVPKYDAEPVENTSKPETETYTLTQFIKDVQSACGAVVDGIAGPQTLSKTVTISAIYNRRHAVVKAIQRRLFELGYVEVGTADGVAGPKFTSAVTHFQRDNSCVVDGIITKSNKTWKKLLGMA